MATSPHLHALYASLLAIAAASDVASRRIPNALVVLVATTGIGLQWSRGGPGAAILGGVAALAVGAPLVVAWRLGVFGGGDVKLAAAAAAGVGLDRLGAFLAAAALAGGLLALATALWTGEAQAVLRRVAFSVGGPGRGIVAGRTSIPYGVAIAAGALYALSAGSTP